MNAKDATRARFDPLAYVIRPLAEYVTYQAGRNPINPKFHLIGEVFRRRVICLLVARNYMYAFTSN